MDKRTVAVIEVIGAAEIIIDNARVAPRGLVGHVITTIDFHRLRAALERLKLLFPEEPP